MFGISSRIALRAPLDVGELALEPAISSPSARPCAIRSSAARLRLLAPRDFLRRRVARRLPLLDRLDERAAVAVERLGAIDAAGRAIERAAPAHRRREAHRSGRAATRRSCMRDQFFGMRRARGCESRSSDRARRGSRPAASDGIDAVDDELRVRSWCRRTRAGTRRRLCTWRSRRLSGRDDERRVEA